MKILFLLPLIFLYSCCECKTEKCGVITEITRQTKHGKVAVLYANGEKEIVSKRRPRESDIGTQYCECVEYK